ncbi:MAG: 5'-methylthioadenosine/S-adenosylhomocysteine nucleosidase [Kiritimatiellae bacterium]|nr:5'-methylthioadenosine/S-adenosylhomocysteine nucleosidase [Kiritimatiellia bacterium]
MKTYVVAMDNEAEALIANLSNRSEKKLYGRRIVEGMLGGERTVVIVSGIGKVNSAAGAQIALGEYDADEVRNFGVAGGLDSSMQVGGLYEVDSAVQYDFDLVQLNGGLPGTLNERTDPYIPCTASGRFPAIRLASGDRFNDSAVDHELITKVLGCKARDMEGAAIAQVCERAGVPFRSLKCISDVYGSGSTTDQYLVNLKKCLAILKDHFAKEAGGAR